MNKTFAIITLAILATGCGHKTAKSPCAALGRGGCIHLPINFAALGASKRQKGSFERPDIPNTSAPSALASTAATHASNRLSEKPTAIAGKQQRTSRSRLW